MECNEFLHVMGILGTVGLVVGTVSGIVYGMFWISEVNEARKESASLKRSVGRVLEQTLGVNLLLEQIFPNGSDLVKYLDTRYEAKQETTSPLTSTDLDYVPSGIESGFYLSNTGAFAVAPKKKKRKKK